MAVESRFVVIRHGVEAKTFMDKKSADEYDKMLDMADNLADVFAQSPIALSESAAEELSIYLAQHREEVLVALLAKKATKPAVAKTPLPSAEETQPAAAVALKSVKAKTSKTSKKPSDKSDKKISAAS
jgi:dsDNA-binding SOS-regulon protein